MSLVLKVPVSADSAFAHKLVSVLDELVKEDRGLIPDKNSAAWYEHIISKDTSGSVNAEAFVLVITPSERFQEGQEKWAAISGAIRELVSDGTGTHALMEGNAVSSADVSENKISFSS